jgi:hypothetical protein
MYKKCILAASISAVMAGSHAADSLSLSADVNARAGALMRSGALTQSYDAGSKTTTRNDFNNTNYSVDGNYGVFIAGNKDLKGGYSAGFYCHTVATTAPGASAAFVAEAIPVKNNWDGYFAGKENYPNNNRGGGFASYGESNGDDKGPFCNDEVYGTLGTPYGTLRVGNIMNPMRMLYDLATVDPLWGNQFGYYNLSDIRGNALNYSNTFGDFRLDLQWQSATSATTPSSAKSKGHGLTALVAYDTGEGSMLGAGLMTVNGAFSAKAVTPAAGGQHNTAWGLMGRTLLGRVNVGYTFITGKQNPDGFLAASGGVTGSMFKLTDHTLKAAFDIGKVSLQGYLSTSKTNFHVPAAWGGQYSVQDTGPMFGKTFNSLGIRRHAVDLWALYNLGNGTQPYLRINTIQKHYSAGEIDYQATMRGTKAELGWLIHL